MSYAQKDKLVRLSASSLLGPVCSCRRRVFWNKSTVPRTVLVMPRNSATLLIVAAVAISGAWATGQQSAAGVARIEGPVTGSAHTERLGTVQWSYHFDHNALKDAELVGRDLVALTESGNLVRFNADTLAITAHQVVAGRVVWLGSGKTLGKTHSIVAVIDARADVMPWPGEPFKEYETRSMRIEQQAVNPLRVLVFARGASKYVPFKQGSFATPNA